MGFRTSKKLLDTLKGRTLSEYIKEQAQKSRKEMDKIRKSISERSASKVAKPTVLTNIKENKAEETKTEEAVVETVVEKANEQTAETQEAVKETVVVEEKKPATKKRGRKKKAEVKPEEKTKEE